MRSLVTAMTPSQTSQREGAANMWTATLNSCPRKQKTREEPKIMRRQGARRKAHRRRRRGTGRKTKRTKKRAKISSVTRTERQHEMMARPNHIQSGRGRIRARRGRADMSRKRKMRWMRPTLMRRENSNAQRTRVKNERKKIAIAMQERPKEGAKTRKGKLGFMTKRSVRFTRRRANPAKRTMLKVTTKLGKKTKSARQRRRGMFRIQRKQSTKTAKKRKKAASSSESEVSASTPKRRKR
mmetsp:Transcript_110392/g.219413  ORF Transcript_110392/g.219413 Transcript_110392/m.219413 type:complete len:240 (-) Transcript_110392:77-796(-)